MADRLVYISGEYFPEADAKISIFDSAVMLADTATDSTRTFLQKPFKLEAHVKRLYQSLKIMRLDPEVGEREMVDLTLEVLTQFVFTLLGLGLLVGAGHYNATVRAVAVGLVIVLPLLLGFVLAQRWGLFSLLERMLIKAAEKRPELGLAGIAGLHDTIQELYRDRRNIAAASGLHLLSWILTSTELWLALSLMGHPVTVGQAIVFLSLGHAVRSAAFLIPSGLGAQEAGFMVLAAMYGLPSGVGLALSLVIRLREIVFGAPALVVWPYMEGRRFFARRKGDQVDDSARR